METGTGQGRKPIVDCSYEESVCKFIKEDRQSVTKAREAWLNPLAKKPATPFQRFSETLEQDPSV